MLKATKVNLKVRDCISLDDYQFSGNKERAGQVHKHLKEI